ncbi:MAG: amidohydrolase family protein [Planctomycetota bacterium]
MLIVQVFFVVAATTPAVTAADAPKAFIGAKILPIEGDPIPDGLLIVQGSKIVFVGPADETRIPSDAERIDVSGKTIMPGLVCTHSHIGGVGAADGSSPIQPGVRVSDSINVHDSGFRRALAGGLTTLNIMPGSGHLSSGQTVYAKLRFREGSPRRVEDLFIFNEDGDAVGGLKMANGTNSMRDAPFPGTRGKSAYLVRQQFILAREYHAKVTRAGGDPEKMPPRDLHLETLVEAMLGKRIVHHHTHRHDDIITVLRLANEFGFRVVLHHVSEGWKVAKEIAESGAPCSVILVDSPGGKLEARYLRFETGKVLDEAGVRVAFHTDDLITDSRYFFRMAALAVRAGMSRERALESLTLAGAEMLDLQNRIGSLRAGKDADFIVLDGDPLSVYTKVLETWVEGQRAFDRSNPKDYLFAVGGYGAGYDQTPYLCCYDESQLKGGAK